MKTKLKILLIIIFLGWAQIGLGSKPVRVGIYQNSPKVFIDERGKPRGIFIDIIEEVAKNEGWKLEYVFGTWLENLNRLEQAEIDILLDVSYSEERAKRFTLSNIFVIDDWLEVFTLKENPVKSVFALVDKRIGVIEGSIQHQYMMHNVKESFNIDYSLFLYPDYPSAIISLKKNEIDAFVASRFFYFSEIRDKDIWPTSLILRPAEVYFAYPKNGNRELMAAVDRNMIKFKNNPQSIYYRAINNWLGVVPKYSISNLIKLLLIFLVVLAVIFMLFTYMLRQRVKAKTLDLVEKNEELEALNNQLQALLLENKLTQDEIMKFQFMVDNARQEVYLVYPNGKLAYVNKAVVKSLIYTYEELINGGISLFDPVFGSMYYEHFEEMRKKELPTFETFHFTKDGRKLVKKIKAFYLRIGKQEYVCGFAEDITEYKKAEKALQESQQLFKTLAHMSPVGIFRTRADGYTTYVNPKWSELSGLPYEQALGDGWLIAVHPDDQEIVKKNWSKRTQEGVKSEAEYRFLKQDGTVIWVLGDAIPEIVDGEIKGYIGTITDITDRKKAELLLHEKAEEIEAQNEEYRRLNIELQNAKLKAEESDRLKTAFLANMSHEIRTPMNAICGFSKLLSRYDVDDAKRNDYVEIINSNALHLLSIINDIVDISKIESGSISVSESIFSLNAMLDELGKSFGIAVSAKKINLICQKELPDKKSQIKSDELKLKQILNNLMSNSIKFTHQGTVEYGYSINGNKIKFFVKDTGIGIPKEAQKLIFERFHQIEDAIIDSRRGTGLGLPISKAYVELLGGEIWVESEKGKGSAFFFTIPYSHGEGKNETKDTIPQPFSLKGKTILIAEDDEPNLLFLSEVLKDMGATIIAVNDGVQAVEVFRKKNNIDIVLMDIKLPRLNGLEAVKEIRKLGNNVSIVAQTAFAFSVDAEKALESGCNAYLSKPIDAAELIKTIQQLLA